MNARKCGIAMWAVSVAACAWAQVGEGSSRYLTNKPGFWQPQQYRGEHGGRATAAEAEEITANLKRIQAVLMTTPEGANPVGYYYLPSPMWTSNGRGAPILQGLSVFPLAFAEFLKNGVWTLDMHGETESVTYSINALAEIERVCPKVFEEPGLAGAMHPIYLLPQRVNALGGFPVYGDTLFIARPGRDLFHQVTVERALKAALSLYSKNRENAERGAASSKLAAREFNGSEYEQKELAMFEKEWGKLRATDVKDYEERKRQWMAPVLRQRKEQEQRAAAPVRGDGQNEQYFDAMDTYAAAQQRLAALTPEEAAAPACYVATPPTGRSYVMQGQVRRGTGSAACTPLVETNPAYYDRTLPRSAAQLITLTSVTRCANSAEAGWFRLPGTLTAGAAWCTRRCGRS